MKNVLIAVLLCDRKAHYQTKFLKSIMEQETNNPETGEEFNITYCINIETNQPSLFNELFEKVAMYRDKGFKIFVDLWNFQSDWALKPKFDQDQSRLFPIVTARNMCVDAALDLNADILQFVDSDMIIPPHTVWKLASWDKNHIGGYVPGRNDHKEALYLFGHDLGIQHLPNGLIECDHANIGFCQIKREVFNRLRFRRGVHPTKGHLQSDDPNFCFDAFYKWGFGRHYVDPSVKVLHIDDDVNSFLEGAQF